MKYQLAKQETDYYCFPACLQAVLKRHGKELTQRDIATKIACNENGSNLNKVAEFLSQLGFDFDFLSYDTPHFTNPESFIKDKLIRNADILVAQPNSKGYHLLLIEDLLSAASSKSPMIKVVNPENSDIYFADMHKLRELMSQRKSGGFCLIEKLN